MTVRFSASYMDRLMACPGSANLDLAIPGWQEPVRDDKAGAKAVGTNVHDILSRAVNWLHDSLTTTFVFAQAVRLYADLHKSKRQLITESVTNTELWLDGTMLGFRREAEMDGIEDVAEVFVLLDPFAPKMLRFIADALIQAEEIITTAPSTWVSEKSYNVTWLQTKPQTTPDLWVYYPETKFLTVVDFKSGAIPVDASESKQLLYYAVTVAEQEDQIDEVETIELVIIQPEKTGPGTRVDQMVLNRAELDAWRDTARAAEQRVLDKDLTLTPSDKGCMFCPANPHTRGDKGTPLCPAMLNMLYPPVIEDDIFDGL